MSKKPGCISSSFHKNTDGKKIANYAQWENQEMYKKAITNLTKEQKETEKTIDELSNDIEFNIYEGNPIFTLEKK